MNDYYEINQIINPNSNEILSKLNKDALLELLILTSKYHPFLRNDLGLDPSITFGLEIEFEHSKRKKIEQSLNPLYPDWIIKGDGSLNKGTEINSPILTDKKENWQHLNEICKIITKYGKIDSHSGGHIHIGAHLLENNYQYWLNFIAMWASYENIIFRFGYGNYLTGRTTINKYAYPIAMKYYQTLQENNVSIEELIRRINFGKYYAVNVSKVKPTKDLVENNTIEFRSPNSSLEAIIWQNNINFFTKFLTYAKSNQYNEDIIKKRLKYYDSDFYNEIYLEQVIELCDLIFTNNLDKITFLHQYLKEFQISEVPFHKCKKFY